MNGIWDAVAEAIPQLEKGYIWDNLLTMAREVTDYNHSALGILKTLKMEYGEENFSLEKINEMLNKLNDPNEL